MQPTNNDLIIKFIMDYIAANPHRSTANITRAIHKWCRKSEAADVPSKWSAGPTLMHLMWKGFVIRIRTMGKQVWVLNPDYEFKLWYDRQGSKAEAAIARMESVYCDD